MAVDHEQKAQKRSFEDLAKEVGADEDEKAWEERLKRIAKQRPKDEPKDD